MDPILRQRPLRGKLPDQMVAIMRQFSLYKGAFPLCVRETNRADGFNLPNHYILGLPTRKPDAPQISLTNLQKNILFQQMRNVILLKFMVIFCS